MLSPRQERLALIVAGLTEAEGFAPAGGAALITRGDGWRQAVHSGEKATASTAIPPSLVE